VWGGGRVNIGPSPEANFKTLVNKNIIKPEIEGPLMAIFLENLDPLGKFGKNFRPPLHWIFKPCASVLPRLILKWLDFQNKKINRVKYLFNFFKR
jgi:hypothetical protein